MIARRTACLDIDRLVWGISSPVILIRSLALALSLSATTLPLLPAASFAQDNGRPTLTMGVLAEEFRLDGVLDEPFWNEAVAIAGLTMVEPIEGGEVVGPTTVWVVADASDIVIGVIARDPDPYGIVSFSKARDSRLDNEDHIKFILDTFLDGRTGYIFALNPSGARYDALVARFGEGENPEWDAIWEARASRGSEGWSAEVRIPIKSLGFGAGLTEWGFNIERRVQRLQETSRWASPTLDARISQSVRAGRLTDLPDFDFGFGATIRPALVSGFEYAADTDTTEGSLEPSLDLDQRLGPNVLATLTFNTDFAETEVDTRRTNLTRFSLFFPEKRTFFLRGADIFDFGLGLTSGRSVDLLPFNSRRIGLFEGETVPLVGGGKMSGRIGNTNFGALATHTGEAEDLVPATNMGVVRVKQNVLEQSSVGMIATAGDPQGRPGAWTAGVDATYQTSRLFGDKNFLFGVWGLTARRDGLTGNRNAFGGKIDYPNDTWDIALIYQWIGDGFDPSLGFVPRRGIQRWSGGANYRLRPGWSWLRWMLYELRPNIVLNLDGQWESYRVFTAPVNWLFESGDRFEFNIMPEGDRPAEPFEISGVPIDTGTYNWNRYRLEFQAANKRIVSGQVSWWFGTFYDGTLHQFQARVAVRPSAVFSLEIDGEVNEGSLSTGDFRQELVGIRLQVNFSSDLQVNSFVQYDNESRLVGTNTRLRWTFRPQGDVFFVYNHNVIDRPGADWDLESNQLLVKIQYAFRM
ncbi:MAG: carbohydrate binding family 9 domain-containing protein [Gemmatimonadota bacterium]|nr:MAG: carbohydrate binding family 9 domain-containing protein [Gemmatimonadota bacterium]